MLFFSNISTIPNLILILYNTSIHKKLILVTYILDTILVFLLYFDDENSSKARAELTNICEQNTAVFYC